jgi:hypothetical protein
MSKKNVFNWWGWFTSLNIAPPLDEGSNTPLIYTMITMDIHLNRYK